MPNNKPPVFKPGLDLVALHYEKCRNEYPFYVWYTHNAPDAIYGDVPERWKTAKALMYVTRKVQEFIEKPCIGAYDILIITMPPQHGKSQSITEALPSWYLGKNPEKRVILVSYNDDTAKAFMRRNKDRINTFGEPIFGIKIGDVKTAEEFELSNKRGGMISRGVGSGITGKPADLMLIDDLIKNREQADSEISRNSLWAEWNDTIKTRLSAKAKIIIVMTSWHEDDIKGRVCKYENPENVTVLRLTCEAEENDVLKRPVGSALCPEFGKNDAWLADFKQAYTRSDGSRSWNALFQGRPTSEQGNMLKRHWWKRYRRNELPRMIQTLISVDAAFKDTKKSDFVSIQYWGKRGADMYLIDRDKRRMDFTSTLDAIRSMVRKHNHHGLILIEDKANGSAIISVLQREIPGIVPVEPKGGKASRASAVSPAIESGNVWIPHEDDEPWSVDFIDECAAFPTGKNDDDVDAMSQALHLFIYFDASIPPENTDEDEDERFNNYDAFLNYGT